MRDDEGVGSEDVGVYYFTDVVFHFFEDFCDLGSFAGISRVAGSNGVVVWVRGCRVLLVSS